jgi:hypothetical protein
LSKGGGKGIKVQIQIQKSSEQETVRHCIAAFGTSMGSHTSNKEKLTFCHTCFSSQLHLAFLIGQKQEETLLSTVLAKLVPKPYKCSSQEL